jgi:hypothetical protein
MNREFVDQLHRYLSENHLRSGALVGPDPGVRFNYRFWRFLKSQLPFIPWQDDLCYLQAQGYWVLANWKRSASGNDRFAQLAIDCSDQMIQVQRSDGAWDYPNPEWRNRVATVEGIWASLGLLQTYHKTGQAKYLDAVLRWHNFFKSKIGFQQCSTGIAVNYFANEVQAPVPNNSALALRYLARLDQAQESTENRHYFSGLRDFLETAQQSSGEVPYELSNPRMRHFQCFQYHGFILLDLLDYYQVTGDRQTIPIIQAIARFLRTGITASGEVMYQCGVRHRFVNYHAAVVFAGLSQWNENVDAIEPDNESSQAQLELIQRKLQTEQRADGSLPHSRGDYWILSDKRSYPRYLAMILYHSLPGTNRAIGQSCLAGKTGQLQA